MYLNTNLLFEGLLSLLKPDLILDIGSRDGKEALRFKNLCPESMVVAYEANPHQFRKMLSDPALAGLVTMRNAAVSSSKGKALFYIARADYSREETTDNNLGQSSLIGDGIHAQEKVEVDTTTIDCELAGFTESSNLKCALWIDVEGAEAEVIRGCLAQRDNVQLIHVECATRPRRAGQKSMHELKKMLEATHIIMGHTSTFWRGWGDAVFVHRNLATSHLSAISRIRMEARSAWLHYIAQRLIARLTGKP